VLYHILKTYLVFLSPIIPHTCEEVYGFFNKSNKLESVHMEKWIDKLDININNIDTEKWKSFDELRSLIFAKLEEIRSQKIINKNNEAIIKITSNQSYVFNNDELKQYLNVAQVYIQKHNSNEIIIEANNAKLIKCERCWNYYDNDKMHDEHICKRCQSVLSNN
jgi:isoleucyl-tRNA synthetase